MGMPLYGPPGICLNILDHDDEIIVCARGGIVGAMAGHMLNAKKILMGGKVLPSVLPDWFPRELAELAVKYIKLEMEAEQEDTNDNRIKALENELKLFSEQ